MTNMNVRVVRWQEIPKEQYIGILQTLGFGDYIDSLPYKVPSELKTFRVPLYTTTEYIRNGYDGMIMPTMDFEKIRCISPEGKETYIWRRN